MSHIREEVKQWAITCYGSYMKLCEDNKTKPIPFHDFAEEIAKCKTTQQIFQENHQILK